MSVAAEFIAPKDTLISLTEIESSEGPCEIYPLPSINFDTSPFKTISATGYKVWNSPGDENIFQQPADLIFEVAFLDWARDDTNGLLFPLREAYRYESKKIQIIAESGTVSKIFDDDATIPTLSRQLTITQAKETWAASEIFNFGRQYKEPTTDMKYPTATEILSSLSSQRFTPSIIEYSATYSVTYRIYFGLFTEKAPDEL